MPKCLHVGSEEHGQSRVNAEVLAQILQRQVARDFLHHTVAGAQVEDPGDALLNHAVELRSQLCLDIRRLVRRQQACPVLERPSPIILGRYKWLLNALLHGSPSDSLTRRP